MKTNSFCKIVGRIEILVSCFAFTSFLLAITAVNAQTAKNVLPTHHLHKAVANGNSQMIGTLSTTQNLHVSIMLPLRNEADLTSLLARLYDPSSSDYRHFLTVSQFTEMFSPTVDDYQAVVNWAQSKGFTVGDQPANRLLVPITGSVTQINQAFNVSMKNYQHPTENRTFFAPDKEPTVDLNVPLWHIAGLDNYSIPHSLYRKGDQDSIAYANTTGSGSGGSFLGSDRRAAYYGGTTLTGVGQAIGLMEFDGYSISDVQKYFSNVGQTLNVPINNVLLDGASAGSDGDDTEQVIDIIDAVSMAPGLSQVLVYIAPYSTLPIYGGDGDTLIFNRMATDNIAKQLSASWNWSPADYTTNDPIFKQFAAQGQSYFNASGDYGAWPDAAYVYPEEDAYVTTVGGTVLTTSTPGGSWESEIAWGGSNTVCLGNGSGGGISRDGITIPSYQQLSGVINSSNMGSTTLRNGPDVAAEANCDNYYCANGSCGTSLGGTSLAAPTWAGYTALVNQQAVAVGGSTIGFLNKLIYPIGVGSNYNTDFHDIVVGDNYNYASTSLYPAVTGYDLVTGWGSPNGQNLIEELAGITVASVLTSTRYCSSSTRC